MLKGKKIFWVAVVILFFATSIKNIIEPVNQVHTYSLTDYIWLVLTLLIIARLIHTIFKMYKEKPFTLRDLFSETNEPTELTTPSNEKSFKHKLLMFFE